MTQITGEDPNKGGLSTAGVNIDKHLLAETVSKTDIEYQSFNKGRAYSISSSYTTGGTNEEVISIQNDSTTLDFVIEEIVLGCSAACNFDVIEVNSGTPTGTSITPRNLKTSAGGSPDLTCFGNNAVTGSLTGDIIAYGGVSAASEHVTLDLKSSVVIGQGDVYAITASATTVTVRVTVFGFFRERI